MIIWYSRLYFRACFYRKQYKPAYFLSGKNLSHLCLFHLYVKFTFFPQLISKVKNYCRILILSGRWRAWRRGNTAAGEGRNGDSTGLMLPLQTYKISTISESIHKMVQKCKITIYESFYIFKVHNYRCTLWG